MNDTRNEIVRLASELIRSIGYNAFSYADISKQLQIKNAAIHYYFPSKADLGLEVIKESIERFKEKTDSWKNDDYRQQFINYITLHDEIKKYYWACLVGALSLSFDTLPENMQKELQILVKHIITWLTDLLAKGKKEKIFTFTGPARTKAYMVHSALLSSLLMNKVLKNDVYETIQSGLLKI